MASSMWMSGLESHDFTHPGWYRGCNWYPCDSKNGWCATQNTSSGCNSLGSFASRSSCACVHNPLSSVVAMSLGRRMRDVYWGVPTCWRYGVELQWEKGKSGTPRTATGNFRGPILWYYISPGCWNVERRMLKVERWRALSTYQHIHEGTKGNGISQRLLPHMSDRAQDSPNHHWPGSKQVITT